MKINQVSEPIFTSQDLITEIYKGNLSLISKARVDPNDLGYMSYVEFVEDNKLDDWPLSEPYFGEVRTQKEYDSYMQSQWYMPDKYKNFDVENHLLNMCKTKEQEDRVSLELELFKDHNMIPLLQFLKYLIDTMQQSNILWGVGRGSSVASYCLYLLGVHKIDSIKYDLDIREFLR